MSMVRVVGFSIEPKDLESKELFNDPTARPLATAIYGSLSSSYLKVLDDFLMAYKKNPHEAINNSDHLKNLLGAYARLKAAFTYPLYEEDLLQLIRPPQAYTHESFAKLMWRTHFKKDPDPILWEKALRDMDNTQYQNDVAFAAALGFAEDFFSDDYREAVFIATLLENANNRDQPLPFEDLLNLMQKTGDILPLFVGNLILGLHQKNKALVEEAIAAAHKEQVILFIKDTSRNGLEIEDAQGKIMRYYFVLQEPYDTYDDYFKLITKFLEKQNITKEQIAYLASSVHQSGFSSIMYDKFYRQLETAEEVPASESMRLRITKDKDGNSVGFIAGYHINLKNILTEEIRSIGFVSVSSSIAKEASLPHESEQKQNEPANLLDEFVPGRYKHSHETIRVSYQATHYSGCVKIPTGLTASNMPFDSEESLRAAHQKNTARLKTLQSIAQAITSLFFICTIGIGWLLAKLVTRVAAALEIIEPNKTLLESLFAPWQRKIDSTLENKIKTVIQQNQLIRPVSKYQRNDETHLLVSISPHTQELIEYSMAQLRATTMRLHEKDPEILSSIKKTKEPGPLAELLKKSLTTPVGLEKIRSMLHDSSANAALSPEAVKKIISVYATTEQYQQLATPAEVKENSTPQTHLRKASSMGITHFNNSEAAASQDQQQPQPAIAENKTHNIDSSHLRK